MRLDERGSVAKTRIIDLENQLRRQGAVIQAHRQDLLTRGLNPSQIESVAKGTFVSTVEIVAPPLESPPAESRVIQQTSLRIQADPKQEFAYEVQELNAELGQQVQAGQLLSTLANHGSLYIEGHAFKREAPFLETAAQKGWSITVEFAEDDPRHWPKLRQIRGFRGSRPQGRCSHIDIRTW